MGRTRIAKAIILSLREKINLAEKGEKYFLDYLNKLEEKYQKGEIFYDFYVETIYKHFEGRTIKGWIEYYDNYIKGCKKKIKEQKKTLLRKKILNSFLFLFFFSVLTLSILNTSVKFTGFGVQEQENLTKNITEFNESDSDEIKGEISQNQTNISSSQEKSPPFSETTEESAEENITKSEENITEISEEEVPVNITENETEVNITEPEENITEEIPEEPETNITESEENATAEVPEEIPETNITENITEEITEEINITANATITTIQQQAVLGQPVKWKKQISPETPGNLTLKLPKEAENIQINKIKEKQETKARASITGGVIGTGEKESIILKIFNFFKNFLNKIFGTITGKAIATEGEEKEIEVEIDDETAEYEIEYETPAPYAIEEDLQNGKKITIVGPETIHYENVLAFTELNEKLNIKNPFSVKIYWIENDSYIPIQNINDSDSNGIYDYIEWVVPSLSEQTFEIIVITKAEHLNENKEFISDIYEEVKELDDIWSEEISDGEYIRVTFERALDNTKDITIYPRITNGDPRIEVYEINGTELIAEFSEINSNEYNTAYLTNLQGQKDVFDLKILDGNIEIDYIVDPLAEITKVGTDTYNSSAASPLEFSHTLVEGDNRLVVVYFGAENNGENDVTSVTYGGQSMTQAVEDGGTGTGYQNRAEIWYILENDLPSNGANTVSATITPASTLDFKAYAAEYTGVNQGIPEATDGTYQTSGSTIENTISPSTDAWVFSAMDEGNTGSWAHGQSQEELWDFQDASSQFAVTELRGADGETSVDSTFTGTANRLARVAASFAPAITNSAPSTPTNITCDGGNCNITIDTTVNINASGSVDDDSDDITYFIEASLEDIVTSENSTDVSMAGSGGSGGGIALYDGFNEGPAEGQVSTSNWADGGGDYYWLYGDGNTPSGTTGDNVNVEGDYFIYIESSSHTNENNYLVSSEFELTSSDTLVLDFLYYMYGAHIQTLKIEIDYDSGWDELWSAGPGQIQTGFGQAWSHGLAYASDGANAPYTGTHQIRINGLSGTSYYGDICVDVVYLNITGGGASNETNTTATEYTDVGVDGVGITNVTIQVDVTSYDPRASVDQSTNDPDLWLEMYNGTGWVSIGNFDLPSTYTGTGLQTNDENFSLSTTDSEILTAWASSVNQDLRIKGVYMDHNETFPDQINYTNIWISINGKLWIEIGNHTESTFLTWNTTDSDDQNCIDLRARAIDLAGSNTYSGYFNKSCCLNISHGGGDTEGPAISNEGANETEIYQNEYFCLNITATDSSGVSAVYAEIWNTTDWLNYTMTDAGSTTCDGGSDDNIYGVEIQGTATGLWNYSKVHANDTLNNWNSHDFSDLTINVTSVPNQAPQITFVSPIPNTDPTESSSKLITFYATMYDADGVGDLNDASVNASFSKSGQTTRYNSSCVLVGDLDANSANYSCTITMWYFDGNGAWTITVYGEDDEPASATNDTETFTYNLLQAIVISPTQISLDVQTGAKNQTSDNDPTTVNNTGNAEITSGNLRVIGIDLYGETDDSVFIGVGNFSVDIDTGGSPPAECDGTTFVNGTETGITGATLPKGNLSVGGGAGQEQLYYCIRQVPQISSQTYSTSKAGSWTIKIVMSFIFVYSAQLSNKKTKQKKKKKKKLVKDDKLIGALNLILDELKEEYSLNKKEIIKIILEKLKTKYKISRREINKIIGGKEFLIPITIFSKELGGLEAITKYMKENLNMNYSDIAKELERNERTIWTAYNKAINKQKESIKPKETKIFLPISIFENNKLTILESVIIYLKQKGLKYIEIAKSLNRDQRNIWTIYSRATKKIKDNNI